MIFIKNIISEELINYSSSIIDFLIRKIPEWFFFVLCGWLLRRLQPIFFISIQLLKIIVNELMELLYFFLFKLERKDMKFINDYLRIRHECFNNLRLFLSDPFNFYYNCQKNVNWSNENCNDDKEDMNSKCILCLENSAKTIFIPCGHVICCFNCTKNLIVNKKDKECPICREEGQIIKMYFS